MIRNYEEVFKDKEKFRCYSPYLREYIGASNIAEIYQYTSRKTRKTCWVYLLTDDLRLILEKWSRQRPPSRAKGGDSRGTQ